MDNIKNHENVLKELRYEHKHLRSNTTFLAKLMAENEAKKAVIEKLKFHLHYYENADSGTFSEEVVEKASCQVQRAELLEKQAELDSEFEKVDAITRAKSVKLLAEKEKVYGLRKKLASQEDKLGSKIETRDMVKEEFIKEEALLKNLVKMNVTMNENHECIHDEVKRLVGFVPFEISGKFQASQILSISELLKEYHLKVSGEFERLRKMYHDKELALYTNNLERIEGKLILQRSRVDQYKSDIQKLKVKKAFLIKSIHDKKNELESLKEADGFKAKFAILTARHRAIIEECDKLNLKIEATKTAIWKQEDADKIWVDRYNRLILDIQEEIGLYRELMSSTGFDFEPKRIEIKKVEVEQEIRYRPTMRGVLTNDQIDRIHRSTSSYEVNTKL